MIYRSEPSAIDDAPRAKGQRRACLIVESDLELRRSLEALVRELGVDAYSAENALRAFTVMDRFKVDLVMTEEFLVGPSGTSLLRAVRYRFPHVARVLISNAISSEIQVRAVNECGAHRVLSKRMHPVALRDEVKAALNEAWLAAPDCHSGGVTIAPFSRSEPSRSTPESRWPRLVRRDARAAGE